MRHIVIIGLGAGGYGALKAAIEVDFSIKITVIEKRDHHTYSPCGIPYAIEGLIDGFEGLKHQLVLEMENVKILLQHEAVSIKPDEKCILVKNLLNDKEFSLSYDALILGTGAYPFIPPIPGIKDYLNRGVYTVRTVNDGKIITKACEKAINGLVIGAGAIGLEVGAALKAHGLNVSIIEAQGNVLPLALDKKMSRIVEKHLKNNGIKLYLNRRVTEVKGDRLVKSVVLDDERIIPADLIVLSTGVRADNSLAKEAGVNIGTRGILTDVCMRTNIEGIYAIGDAVETVSLITHRPTIMQLAGTAYRQGTVAGVVAAGGYTHYCGSTNTWVSVVSELQIAATGLSGNSAKEHGFKLVSGFARGLSKPAWFPGGQELMVYVLADFEDGRILGAQAIGKEAAVEKIEVVGMAIKAGLTIHDLANAEMAYCPAVSEVTDPLTDASQIAVNRLKKKK